MIDSKNIKFPVYEQNNNHFKNNDNICVKSKKIWFNEKYEKYVSIEVFFFLKDIRNYFIYLYIKRRKKF